jgi:hypothetical protein
VCLGPDPLPGRHGGDLGLLFGQQLLGELADLGQAAVVGLSGGQLATGAGLRRLDLDKGQVKGASAPCREPLEVGRAGVVDLLVASSVW